MTTTGTATTPIPSGDLQLVRRGEPGWDEARRAWNLAVDQQPDMVALPTSAEEVAAAVRLARESGLRIAVQGTGHGAYPRGGALEGAMLLNTAGMREVRIDPQARIARAEAGALWSDVVPVAAEHGLAALHGSSPDVGVIGYTLGGGVGWLARSHGFACNAVTAVELVTPDGRRVRADAATEADLFWAIRGGGGNFGVVTAIEFRLFPVAEVYAGWLIWPWEAARRVLGAWAEWLDSVPDQVTSIGRLLQLPPLPELPEVLRGRSLVAVEAAFTVPQAQADRLLAPLRTLAPEIDTFRRGPATMLADLHMDPPQPVPGIGHGALVDALPPEAVHALVGVAGPGSGSPLLSVEVRHLGGALGRIPPGAGACAYLDGDFALFGVGIPMTPEIGAAIEAQIDRLFEAMARWGFGRTYLNFAERPVDSRTAFDTEAHRRLCAVRARYDADALLRPNHEIAPG